MQIAIEVDNPTGANAKVVLPDSTVNITCVAVVNYFYAHFSWAAPNGAEVTFLLSNHEHSVISTAVTKDVGYGPYTCSANDYNMNRVFMVVFHIILAGKCLATYFIFFFFNNENKTFLQIEII